MIIDLTDFKKKYEPKKEDPIDQVKLDKLKKEISGNVGKMGYLKHDPKVHSATIDYIAKKKLGISKKGLVFVGNAGTGKTVSCELITACLYDLKEKTGIHGNFFNSETIEQGYVSSKNKLEYMKQFYDMETLIIDDIGREKTIHDYGNKSEVLTDVITIRYDLFKTKGYQMVMSTNLSTKELTDRYGGRAFSRLMEMCILIGAQGKDKRKEKLEIV